MSDCIGEVNVKHFNPITPTEMFLAMCLDGSFSNGKRKLQFVCETVHFGNSMLYQDVSLSDKTAIYLTLYPLDVYISIQNS